MRKWAQDSRYLDLGADVSTHIVFKEYEAVGHTQTILSSLCLKVVPRLFKPRNITR